MKKNIIFDFNGTMLFDTHLHTRAWDIYAPTIIGRRLTQEELDTFVIGQPNDLTFRRLLGEDTPDEVIARHTYDKEAVYRRLCLTDPTFHLVDGLVEFLDYLKAESFTMTIATGAPWENLQMYREHFDLDRWFSPDDIIYDDGTYPGKPAPDIYLLTMARLGAKPADCIIFEDSFPGVKSAHAAGVENIIALRPDGDEHFYDSIGGVTRVLRDFTDFRSLVLC